MTAETVLLAVVVVLLCVGGIAGLLFAQRLRASIRRLDRLQEANARANARAIAAVQSRVENRPSRAFRDGLNKALWPQIDGLVAIYRIIDGKPALPPTRGWPASPDFLRHLLIHMERQRPRIVVECGCGTSTVALALTMRTLGIDGHIYSLEHQADYARAARETLRLNAVEQYVTVVDAPLSERRYAGREGIFQWYDVPAGALPGDVDMLVVDGPPGDLNALARYPAGPELLPSLRSTASIFIDDAARRDEKAMIELWRQLRPDLQETQLTAEKGASRLSFAAADGISAG